MNLINIECEAKEKENMMKTYNELDSHVRTFIKKHPLVVMGLALAAGFLTHLVVEKVLAKSES